MLQIAKKYATKAKINIALSEKNFKYRFKTKSMRLRIGYVSSDFNNHPLSHLLQSVFGYHDRSKYEVYCYALKKSDGSRWRHKIESECEHFVDVSHLHSSDIAQMINDDSIHILINLNGYTKNCKNDIFALRPAPIQVNKLLKQFLFSLFMNFFSFFLFFLLRFLSWAFVVLWVLILFNTLSVIHM